MAYVPLVPITMNISQSQGASQQFQSAAVKNFSGTAIDLSAWVSLTAKAVPITPSPTGADVTFGTVTADSAGIITLVTATTDFGSNGPGNANIIITGKPTSGDVVQKLATGLLTLSQG